ncbi:5'-nucleotidase [Caerostris extrusa]|uniref:5'-nucleotidase n=1 Tax=Caerostris extrusa TaxID=172846 RepID=A0AAV4QCM5_CAEEX|nr:5'-nucleotidase [Caerostris extrusa]
MTSAAVFFELSAFLYGMKFPCSLCQHAGQRDIVPAQQGVNKSVVLDINGERIGIIGYLHPEALDKSRKAVSVKFYPEIPAIKEEVQRLEKLGVNKIIALGHSGYHTDLDIAKTVKGVDVVIGGNSDIVLEEPVDGDDELSTVGNIHGNYPRVHHHEHDNYTESELKNRTLVLHIPQHGKYVGVIRAVFDDKGRIVHESGEPVLLDKSIPQDEETLKYLKDAQLILEDVTRHAGLPVDEEVLAEAKHEFESRRCRVQECSLGNLVTDGMLQMYKDSHAAQGSRGMKPVDAVIFNAGCLRYPIPEAFSPTCKCTSIPPNFPHMASRFYFWGGGTLLIVVSCCGIF